MVLPLDLLITSVQLVSSLYLPRTPTPNSSPFTRSSSRAFPLLPFPRRRPHKRKIHRYRLIQQLHAICPIDSGSGIIERRVLDQYISLPIRESVRLPSPHIRDEEVSIDSPNLHISSPPVQIEMQILNISILAKELIKVLFARLFVYICCHYDPAFDRTDGCRACCRTRIIVTAGLGAGFTVFGLWIGGVRVARGCSLVNFHFGVDHGCNDEGRERYCAVACVACVSVNGPARAFVLRSREQLRGTFV